MNNQYRKKAITTTEKNVQDRLDDLVEASGKNAAIIAGEVGISPGTLSKYRNGQAEMKIDNLVTLAKYFGVTSDYLLGISDSKEPVDTDVTILVDRFGFTPKAARLITEWSIPANGARAIKRFKALNALVEQNEFEAILLELYVCMTIGERITYYENELYAQNKYPQHNNGVTSAEEIFVQRDKGLFRSASIYDPVFLFHKIAERLVAESEESAKQKTARGDQSAEDGHAKGANQDG